MRSLVAHHYWGSPGGGQLVCASAALALDELGYRPVLAGTFRFDPSRYLEWYGIDLRRYETVTLPFGARAFGLWSRLFVWYPALKAVKRFKPDLVFIDEVAYKPLLKRKTFHLVEYIHFPYEVAVDPRFRGTGLTYGEDPYIMERYGRFPLNLYWRVYTWLLPRYMRDNPFRAADVVLTNSRWTASVAEMVYGEEPEVLNPPLPPNVEVVERPRPFEEREPVVVMPGRFSQEKRYHWVMGKVAPRLVKEVPGARLVIAVAEAMARGLPVVVHKSGGLVRPPRRGEERPWLRNRRRGRSRSGQNTHRQSRMELLLRQFIKKGKEYCIRGISK